MRDAGGGRESAVDRRVAAAAPAPSVDEDDAVTPASAAACAPPPRRPSRRRRPAPRNGRSDGRRGRRRRRAPGPCPRSERASRPSISGVCVARASSGALVGPTDTSPLGSSLPMPKIPRGRRRSHCVPRSRPRSPAGPTPACPRRSRVSGCPSNVNETGRSRSIADPPTGKPEPAHPRGPDVGGGSAGPGSTAVPRGGFGQPIGVGPDRIWSVAVSRTNENQRRQPWLCSQRSRAGPWDWRGRRPTRPMPDRRASGSSAGSATPPSAP